MKRISLTFIVIIFSLFVVMPKLAVSQYYSIGKTYSWYAEEKLTVSTTAKQLTSGEYDYLYGATRITVEDPNVVLFVVGEVVTDQTTNAMGTLMATDQDPNDASSISYLDIQILYNGLDAAGFDPNDVIDGAGGASCTIKAADSYTRGTADRVRAGAQVPEIAVIHLIDNGIIWTSTGSTPVYNATDASCFGEKLAEGDTLVLYGYQQISNFKAVRDDPNNDAIIYVRYGI